MSRLRPDFASGKLSDASISTSATAINSAQFTSLPVVAAPDVIELVLDPYAIYGAQERVIVTSHVNATDTVVAVTRGAYGSTVRAHNQSGNQEDWCASITDQDFYHSTLYGLANDDHTQYLNSTRHTVAGAHANTNIQQDVRLPGELVASAGLTIWPGWLLCDGSAVSRTTYANLWAALNGAGWGTGDGSTTFNLPDLRGRLLMGSGAATAFTSARTLATYLGEELHVTTQNEMPSHGHNNIDEPGAVGSSNEGWLAAKVTSSAEGLIANANGSRTSFVSPNNVYTGLTGGGAGHNNIQPSAVVNWLIKT